MAERNVIWTRTADLQFVGVLEYWVKRNESNLYSKKVLQLVSERTGQIADNPLLYKETEFDDVRVSPMGHYSIYYKEFEKEIIATAFWDNRQNPEKLLEILKNK